MVPLMHPDYGCTASKNFLSLPGYESTVKGSSVLHGLLRATLSIIRSDDFDFPEDGAVFEITDEEGVVLFSGAIGKDGLLSAVLPLGTNIVTAISAPEDYIIDDAQRRCF